MNIRPEQLTQQLKNKLSNLYVISGDEIVLVQECCDQVKSMAKQHGFSEIKILTVDKDFAWEDFQLEMQSGSLFGDQTLIELRMPSGKPGDKGRKVLQDYLDNIPTDKLLLLVTNKIDAATQKTKWFSNLINAGVFVQIWPISLQQLPGWIGQRLQREGMQASPDGLRLLAEYAEGNLLAAVQEIEKLFLLYGAVKLSTEQIATAVSDNSRFTIFDLVDVTLEGNITKSIKILASLKAEKTEPTVILWALTRELRSLYNMAEQLQSGKNMEMVLQQNRVWNNRKYLVQKALRQHKLKNLQQLLQKCAAADRIIKGAESGNVWDQFESICVLLVSGKHV